MAGAASGAGGTWPDMTTTLHGLVNPPGWGVAPGEHDCIVTARNGALSKGYCYTFAALQSAQITNDSVTLSTTPGDVGYPYANATGTAAADARAGRFCVALEDIADGATGRVRVRGIVSCAVKDTTNNPIPIGKELYAIASGFLEARTINTGTSPRKYLGLTLEANSSTPSTATQLLVDFDGWNGVGSGGNVT